MNNIYFNFQFASSRTGAVVDFQQVYLCMTLHSRRLSSYTFSGHVNTNTIMRVNVNIYDTAIAPIPF